MNNTLLLHWHLGLGDAIICNAIVREYAKRYDHVYLPTYNHNRWSIQDMFDDLENVSTVVVKDDAAMLRLYIANNKLPLGCYSRDGFNPTIFDQEFYRHAGMDFNQRWEGFRWGGISQHFIPNEPMIFVHEDRPRGFKITKKVGSVKCNHPILFTDGVNGAGPELKFKSIASYIGAIRNAKEIHCIDSSFALLIDSLPEVKDTPKFIHRYARPNSTYPTYRNGWEILT